MDIDLCPRRACSNEQFATLVQSWTNITSWHRWHVAIEKANPCELLVHVALSGFSDGDAGNRAFRFRPTVDAARRCSPRKFGPWLGLTHSSFEISRKSAEIGYSP